MDLSGGRRSSNIEDRRGQGGLGRPLAYGGGAATIVVALVVYLLGGDPTVVLDSGGGGYAQRPSVGGGTGGSGRQANPAEEQLKDFVSRILANTEDTWPKLLEPQGVRYTDPHLVLFTDVVESACGSAESAMGPFYCPADQKVYLDLGFFQELDQRFGAPGDFAQAYVVAHEIGHHVQNLMGTAERVHAMRARSRADANALSVLQELQADCFAGIWAHYAPQQQRGAIEPGDIEEGLRAAAAIGDDTLQKRSGGRVVPESFTHGSSEQRVTWFRRGFEQGTLEACDTFGSARGSRPE